MHQEPLAKSQSDGQRLTPAEVRAVVGLWAQRRDAQERQRQQASIQDIAEGLDIPVEEAASLLAEVRARLAPAYDRWEHERPASEGPPQGVQTEVMMAVSAIVFLFMMLLSAGFLH